MFNCSFWKIFQPFAKGWWIIDRRLVQLLKNYKLHFLGRVWQVVGKALISIIFTSNGTIFRSCVKFPKKQILFFFSPFRMNDNVTPTIQSFLSLHEWMNWTNEHSTGWLERNETTNWLTNTITQRRSYIRLSYNSNISLIYTRTTLSTQKIILVKVFEILLLQRQVHSRSVFQSWRIVRGTSTVPFLCIYLCVLCAKML